MNKILCIDDDTDICLLLQRFLTKEGYTVDTAFDGNNGLNKLKSEKFDLVLCDFRLPDKDGLQMIKEIKKIQPFAQIIIITGYSDVRMAVKAMKYGAHEYVTKPLYPEEILLTIKDALSAPAKNEQQQPVASSGSASASRQAIKKTQYIQGESPRSKQLQKLIELVAPTDMTVLLLGESGTGKEVTARIIHELSSRADKPIVAVDCGALPPELASSELFGHKKGSFTGALFDKKGHFELANGGTLFLDEIGNLSYDNQIKLLRVLQERKVRPIGDTKDIDVDVRIIVATHEDLKASIRNGAFREDIYYRLNEFTIELPALRERKEDLILYAWHFLGLANSELNKSIEGFSPEVINKFRNYNWPGNLREMKNVIKRAALLCQESFINISELPLEMLNPPAITDTLSDDADANANLDLKTVAERAEKKAILNALVKTGYNKSKTAAMLRVDRKTLYNKMTALGIDPKS